ncbi:hypothetical protein PUN28_017142 [Cardiocondyla obscurior]|uniref:Ribosomal protein L36 n=1 Tax=Cardiocondyla obscurior TaxID=286306 RepID=A0AAW2ELQ5_9HYME
MHRACPDCKLKSNGNRITCGEKRHVIYRGERCRARHKALKHLLTKDTLQNYIITTKSI